MTATELFAVLAKAYEAEPDDFTLSIGHFYLPCPGDPVSIFNLPEFSARTKITMADVRRWANGDAPTVAQNATVAEDANA